MAERRQDKTPEVSVIMNCLNCSKYLKEAIESVYAQTFTDWEIIFWDNASTDRSAEIAGQYDQRLRYFKSEQTEPLGEARNRAISKSSGKYLAFLDCDDLWLPEKLQEQIPLFIKNPRVGLVFADSIYFNDNGDVRLLYDGDFPLRGEAFGDMLGDYRISLETVVIRKSALDSLGEWFDKRFTVLEETELFLRIAYAWEVDYVEAPLSKWRMHAGSWTFSKKSLFPEEGDMMIKKFEEIFPDIQTQYPTEFKSLRVKNLYSHAIVQWEGGRPGEARKHLGPIMLEGGKYFLIYFMTFLPYPIFEWLKNRRGASPDSSASGAGGT